MFISFLFNWKFICEGLAINWDISSGPARVPRILEGYWKDLEETWEEAERKLEGSWNETGRKLEGTERIWKEPGMKLKGTWKEAERKLEGNWGFTDDPLYMLIFSHCALKMRKIRENSSHWFFRFHGVKLWFGGRMGKSFGINGTSTSFDRNFPIYMKQSSFSSSLNFVNMMLYFLAFWLRKKK